MLVWDFWGVILEQCAGFLAGSSLHSTSRGVRRAGAVPGFRVLAGTLHGHTWVGSEGRRFEGLLPYSSYLKTLIIRQLPWSCR